jgi:hypothetical protein
MSASIHEVIRAIHELVAAFDAAPNPSDAERACANSLRSALKTYAAIKPETYAAALAGDDEPKCTRCRP